MSTEKSVESINAVESEQKSAGTIDAVKSVSEKPVEVFGDANEALEQDSEPTKEEFETLLSEGKKALVIGNLDDAVYKLADSSAISVQLFGEFAPETFTPHFYYGKALLELVSAERELFESKPNDVQADESDSIIGKLKEGLQALIQQSMAENQNKEESKEGETSVEKKDEKPELNEVVADQSDVEMKNETTAEAAEIDIDQTVNNEEEDLDEDVETSQLAFEALDYARLVCEKNVGSDALTWLGRQKDTLIELSKISLNDDNFETAVQDLNTALNIVNENFATELREIAFLNMELVHILRKMNNYPSAIEHVENAIKALEQFKAKVQAESQNDDGKLLNEITELLEEVIGQKEILCNYELEKENATVSTNKTSSGEEIKSVDASNIKRKEKRAAVDEPDNESTIKKAKTDA